MKKLKLTCLTILNLVLFTAVANANLVDKIVEKAAGGKSKDLVQGELSFSGTTIWILLAILLLGSSLLNLAFQIAGQFGGVSSTPVGDALQATVTGTVGAVAGGTGAIIGAGARKGLSLIKDARDARDNQSIASAPSAGAKNFEEKDKKKPNPENGAPGNKDGADSAPDANPGTGTGVGGGKPPVIPSVLPNKDAKKNSAESKYKKDTKPTAALPDTDKKSKTSAGTHDYTGSTVETPNKEKPSLLGRIMSGFKGEDRTIKGERDYKAIERDIDIKNTGSSQRSFLDDMKQKLGEIKNSLSGHKKG